MNSDWNKASDKANINKSNRIRGRPKSSYSARALVFEDSDQEIPSTQLHEATTTAASPNILSKSTTNKLPLNVQKSVEKTIESFALTGTSTVAVGKIATKGDHMLDKDGAEGDSVASTAVHKSLKTYRVGEHNAMHHRKTYHTQHSHSLRSNEISNMVKVRHSTLGKSAPSLSANVVSLLMPSTKFKLILR